MWLYKDLVQILRLPTDNVREIIPMRAWKISSDVYFNRQGIKLNLKKHKTIKDYEFLNSNFYNSSHGQLRHKKAIAIEQMHFNWPFEF